MYNNKVAIVTGGASGIGREMCLYLAQRGSTLIIVDINQEKAEEVAAVAKSLGVPCEAKRVDVTSCSDVDKLVAGVKQDFGRIDLMINNAGIGLDGEFKDMTLAHWKRVIDINLWGVIYGTHFVYPMMIKQGFGQIVNVSSVAGLATGGLMTSYTASKHAVVGLTLGLRAEAYQYGVKVNVLCPGFIETPLHDSTLKVSEYLLWEKNQRDKTRFPTAKDCIKPMMRGIEKNRAIIVAPKSQKIYWWVYRLFPSLIPFFWKRIIKKMKEV
ncbi:MAG: SDR family oxidoreductase [Bacteroidota bacterium]